MLANLPGLDTLFQKILIKHLESWLLEISESSHLYTGNFHLQTQAQEDTTPNQQQRTVLLLLTRRSWTLLHFGKRSHCSGNNKEDSTYLPAGSIKEKPEARKTKWSRCMVLGCRPPATWARPASDEQPSPQRPPSLPSWGLTQKIPHPDPGLQNSFNAPQRPPFVPHSSNQLSTAHLLSTGAQTPGHCSSVC